MSKNKKNRRSGPPQRVAQQPSHAQLAKLGMIAKSLDNTFFECKTENIDLAIKFKRDHSVNFEERPQLELTGKFAQLPEDTQTLLKEAMGEFAQAISKCLSDKTYKELRATGQHQMAKALKELCDNNAA